MLALLWEGDPLCDGVLALKLCHVGNDVHDLSRFWSAVQKNCNTFRRLSYGDGHPVGIPQGMRKITWGSVEEIWVVS